ncbi:GIY-YIG nuclease family protein [Phenylobacterium sp.]|uniref:GIY-YIG nuclease family protein n=1 Tax=Phenylobacterium sp. TaxID=1871053 RepID=UPI002612B310|nr:GIY-YIG nuclease family protein [Phenylobacterium sp.]
MDRTARRAAVAAYKDRKPAWGVFAVICEATGQAWVGTSRHVDTEQNGLWFALRLGSCPYAGLQAAWTQHGGAEAFRFEELERLREDYPEIGRPDELKRRQALWRARLEAAAL